MLNQSHVLLFRGSVVVNFYCCCCKTFQVEFWNSDWASSEVLNFKQRTKVEILIFFIQRSHTGTIREMIAKKFPGSEVITAGGSGWSFKNQTQKTSL